MNSMDVELWYHEQLFILIVTEFWKLFGFYLECIWRYIVSVDCIYMKDVWCMYKEDVCHANLTVLLNVTYFLFIIQCFHVNEINMGINGLRQGPKDINIYQVHNYTMVKQCLVTLLLSISILITTRVYVSASRLNSDTMPSISFKYDMYVRILWHCVSPTSFKGLLVLQQVARSCSIFEVT